MSANSVHASHSQFTTLLGRYQYTNRAGIALPGRSRDRPLHDLVMRQTQCDRPRQLVDRDGLTQLDVFRLQAACLEGAREHRQEVVEPERLENIILCSIAQCPHGRVDSAVSRHHDSGQVAVDLVGRAQQRDAVHLRHHQIGEQEIELPLAQLRESLAGRGEPSGCIPFRLERVAQRCHQRRFIVHDEQPRNG